MVFCAKQLNSLNTISETFVVSFIFEIVTTETPKPEYSAFCAVIAFGYFRKCSLMWLDLEFHFHS